MSKNWRAIGASFLFGIISIAVGIALYEGELFFIDGNPTLQSENLPWRISWPAFVIGGIVIAIGLILLFVNRDQD